ncbi:hypothetical protein ACLB2K_048172 [Fragaria x ananassa]
MRILAEYCLPLVRVGGLFVAAKGHDPQMEVKNAEKAIQILGASIRQLCPVESHSPYGQRTAIVCLKTSPTPKKYPRDPANLVIVKALKLEKPMDGLNSVKHEPFMPDQRRTSALALKCGRPSIRHCTALARARLHPSSVLDHFPSPTNSSFPAKSPKTSNKVDLSGKLEFDGLAGDGKWSGKLLESAGVETRPRRWRTEGRPLSNGSVYIYIHRPDQRRISLKVRMSLRTVSTSMRLHPSSIPDHFSSPTRRGWKVIGDAAGVRWGGGAPSPAPYGGERRDVRKLVKVWTSLLLQRSNADDFPSLVGRTREASRTTLP